MEAWLKIVLIFHVFIFVVYKWLKKLRKNVCFSNTFWLYQLRVSSAQFLSNSNLNSKILILDTLYLLHSMFPLISIQYHLLSSSSLIFLSQIVIQIANAAFIYNWGKKGVSQNDFRLPKMKPTWGHFPFTDLLESCFYHLLHVICWTNWWLLYFLNFMTTES